LKSFLIDMDGVLVRGPRLVPVADAFVERLTAQGRKFSVLTNKFEAHAKDLEQRLKKVGLSVGYLVTEYVNDADRAAPSFKTRS
jgi:ribonucleotide monophosphatase NagD (HAD superfamily)